jgi:hypothetical protein
MRERDELAKTVQSRQMKPTIIRAFSEQPGVVGYESAFSCSADKR